MIALLDALAIPRAVLAGYDWGGRAACVVAALWPSRVTGLVSVNGYLIQDIAAAMQPLRPDLEAGFWYFFYFLTERGRAGLTADRRGIAEVIWRRNSPKWAFGEVAGVSDHAELERALARLPVITVPAVTLDGTADGNFPATDGRAGGRGALHRAAPAPAGGGRRAQPAPEGAGRLRGRGPGGGQDGCTSMMWTGSVSGPRRT